MSIATDIAGRLPEDWLAYEKDGEVYYRPILNQIGVTLVWNPDEESLYISDWALDELAKKGYAPNLEYDDSYGWCVSFSPPKSQRDYTETYPTKTLALAYALVEVMK